MSSRDNRLGAIPEPGGDVRFRVWSPNARSVDVRIGGESHGLEGEANGVFAGVLRASPGDDYLYVLDGGRALPDPCSRFQPRGNEGPSRIVGLPSAVRRDLSLEELVIYELHVGTFSPEGTFDGVGPFLPELRELGVTAVELMPVGTFPGQRGWGYDGLYAYAPHPAYGGPDGLARLVEAAHREGLGVILDVVYNHLGPGSEAITAFGPYVSRPPRDLLGGRARLPGVGRPRVGDPERAHVGRGVRDRRATARRGPRDLRRLTRATCSPSSRTASTQARRGRS